MPRFIELHRVYRIAKFDPESMKIAHVTNEVREITVNVNDIVVVTNVAKESPEYPNANAYLYIRSMDDSIRVAETYKEVVTMIEAAENEGDRVMDQEVRCEKCGAVLDHVLVDEFDREGADYFLEYPIIGCETDAAFVDTNQNWTGYGLSEEELPDTIRCPHCGKYPFNDTEIQVYDIVRVVMFRGKRGEEQ